MSSSDFFLLLSMMCVAPKLTEKQAENYGLVFVVTALVIAVSKHF